METKTLIKEIFDCPTAPFREHWVSEKIESLLKKKRIPYFFDIYGNLYAGARSIKTIPKNSFCFMAHMDHPGFHIDGPVSSSSKSTTYRATWYGGAPFKKMRNAAVRIHSPENPNRHHLGRIIKLHPSTKGSRGRKIEIRLNSKTELDKNSFGAFAFHPYRFQGDRISARVCDDLAGVVIALGALFDTLKSKKTIAIFTRAEEVGFVGCWAMLKQAKLQKTLRFVSLEASKHLQDARLGKGPVIRLGDRSTLFNSKLTHYMWVVAEGLKKKKRSFKYQRRVLDGGSCEATALGIFKYNACGISVPLLNYHNDGPNAPGPEIISFKDVQNARELCTSMIRNEKSFKKITEQMELALEKNYRQLKPLLIKKHKYTSRL